MGKNLVTERCVNNVINFWIYFYVEHGLFLTEMFGFIPIISFVVKDKNKRQFTSGTADGANGRDVTSAKET